MLNTGVLARSSFWLKAGVALLLVALADRLFLFHEPGTTVGVFALAWIVGLLLVRPGLRRDPRAVGALLVATGMGLVLADRPSPLAWLLFLLAIAIAALSARIVAGEPVWRWGQRLIIGGLLSVAGPILDWVKLNKRGPRVRSRRSPWPFVRMLALPVIGGWIFIALFAQANPLISDALGRMHLPTFSGETVVRAWVWIFVLGLVWAVLRPRRFRKVTRLPSMGTGGIPGVTVASVTLSLIVFNALFAVQNGLDVAFLWSGAPLPGDMGLADYAHRGAYPLIVTALLAGLFVLICLRPGTETAGRPLIRGLVTIWVGQNMLLVASSILRTVDYVQSYGLTSFRIAAMIWMAMVGLGLLLICWRLLRGKDGNWLIDANVKLALVVLAAVGAVDLGAISAWWNVRHAAEVGGPAVELDLRYLHDIGAPALVSLVELEQRVPDSEFRARVTWVREDIQETVQHQQSERRGWIWRDARRLARVERLTAGRPLPRASGNRDWDGAPFPPPAPAPAHSVMSPTITASPTTPAPAPLTSTPGA
ncbi:MAG: DUF4173 domain-containing protein [Brevundimonas sp.]|nr:MAG: DUF4173 domain-containing protein [Brevundimonas sp.]